jgi:uncharacterized protein (DUF697 family)
VPSWNDLGNVWSTLREMDVNAIRAEAEQPLVFACIGDEPALDTLAALLRRNQDRYPGVGIDPLARYALPLPDLQDLRRADLLLLALDARQPFPALELDQLEGLGIPLLVVLLNGASLPVGAGALGASYSVVIEDPDAPAAAGALAKALLERLPGELHLAAARRLPGLRTELAREMIGGTSFTNATYSLATGLPEQIPIFSVPFAAADMLVLTKNQALLVYKLALAYGAPPDFQSRIREVLPVVGGAFLWRQLARSLVGLIPVWGLLPKVAVAYAGTYTTGVAAWRWYARGELVSGEQLKRISQDAIGRERAQELIKRVQAERKSSNGARKPSWLARLRRMLPGGKKKQPPALSDTPGAHE